MTENFENQKNDDIQEMTEEKHECECGGECECHGEGGECKCHEEGEECTCGGECSCHSEENEECDDCECDDEHCKCAGEHCECEENAEEEIDFDEVSMAETKRIDLDI